MPTWEVYRRRRGVQQHNFARIIQQLTPNPGDVARLAKTVGVSYPSAWRWRHGVTEPTAEHARLILALAQETAPTPDAAR